MAKTGLIVLVIVLVVIVAFAGVFLFQGSEKESDKGKELTPPTPELPEETGDKNIEETETQPKTYNIKIEDFAFSQKELRIKVGDTVIWTNFDSASHTATSDAGNEISSTLLQKGKTYSKTFNTAGTFNYHCTPHSYMKGKIIVE